MIAVGVDAGGSHVVAAVGRDGEITASAGGGPANPTNVGIDDAADAILRTIRKALGGALPDAIYVGAAGAARDEVAQSLRSLIQSSFPRAIVEVGDDASIALRSTIPSGPGIALVAGTGSIAIADDGIRTYRVGGLGSLLGDEGSAYWIGLQALRYTGRVYDGREPHGALSEYVARRMRAGSRSALLDAVYDRKPTVAAIAALATGVIALAGKGEHEAIQIVEAAADELAALVREVARISDLLERRPPIVLAGGLISAETPLRLGLERRLTRWIEGATIVYGTGRAHLGALRIAESIAQGRS